MPRDRRLYMTFPNDMHRHPKVARLSLEARWAFVEMNGEARLADNDGLFPAEDALYYWSADLLSELCASHPTRPLVVHDAAANTYLIRDYAEHQQTRAERESLSEKRSNAGRLGGIKTASAKQVLSNSEQSQAEIEREKELEKEIDTSTDVDVVADRADVQSLCTLLAYLIEQNGSKRPTVGKGWLDAARLMLDKDGREVEKAARLIRWSQQDEFWRSNILSMPKFREKYDQLRLAAEQQRTGYVSNTEHNLAYLESLKAQERAAAFLQIEGAA